MSLHAEIKSFLSNVYCADNTDGARAKLEQAIALLKRVEAEPKGKPK